MQYTVRAGMIIVELGVYKIASGFEINGNVNLLRTTSIAFGRFGEAEVDYVGEAVTSSSSDLQQGSQKRGSYGSVRTAVCV